MLQTGTFPDDESYNLVVGLLIRQNLVDSSLKYLDLILKSGYTLSLTVFTDYIRACMRSRRLDTLTSIIEKCKVHILGMLNLVDLSYLGLLIAAGLGSQCYFFGYAPLNLWHSHFWNITFCIFLST